VACADQIGEISRQIGGLDDDLARALSVCRECFERLAGDAWLMES
jgi:hypothetical protein